MSLPQLITQVVIIFLLMLLGALIRKLGYLHLQSINDITNITLYFLSPLVILRAFEQKFSLQRVKIFLVVLLIVFLAYFISMFAAHFIFKHEKNLNLRRIALYGSIYSNNGFMGVPLAQALFGSNGVFYAVSSMIGFNVLSWTHGIGIFQKKHGNWYNQIRQIILNPNIIAIFLGMIIFVTSFQLPGLVKEFINYGANAFTPMSMIIIGSNLIGVKLNDIKLNKTLSLALALRNLIFPILNLVLLELAGINGIPLYTTIILAACPVAGLVVLFTLEAKGDTKPAVVLMSISTILSLVTIPLVFILANLHL